MCNILLTDSSSHNWQVTVTDAGLLQTTLYSLPVHTVAGPYLTNDTGWVWRLTADSLGRIVSTKTTPPTIQQPLPYVPLTSPGGVFFKLTVNSEGMLGTTSTNKLLPDFIPYIPDVAMSKWPDSVGITCSRCGNTTVSVSADLSAWCCICSAFVPDDDTTILVILDE